MKKYLINTYGCQMNVHESEKIAGVLKDFGYEETTDVNEADCVVFNTCCIREGAEQKIFGNVGALKKLKQKKKDLIIAVLGCMTQQKTSAENLKKRFPWIDIIIGTFNSDIFSTYFQEALNKKKTFEVLDKELEVMENTKFFRTSGYNAWVNIMYGCNNFCSYCIVPYVRGRERSRKSEDIIKEVKGLIAEGYKKITLLGQNVNSYGNDKQDEISFAQLCKEICKLDGDFRLSFMTSHPKDFSDELIDVIASEKKMGKYVHLPVQSGNNEILTAMNRKYTIEKYEGIIKKLREKVPDVVLTSDFIVGFPGETEEQFMDTYALVEGVRYNSIFAFIYSKRRGTVAEKMEGHIALEEKRRRVNLLLDLQHKITAEKAGEFVGKKLEVIINKEKDEWIGVTESGLKIWLKECDKEMLTYQTVVVLSNNKNKLIGEIVS